MQLEEKTVYYPRSGCRLLVESACVSQEYRALPVVNTVTIKWQHTICTKKHLLFSGYCSLDLCRKYTGCTFNEIVISICPRWLQHGNAIDRMLITTNRS